MINNNKKYTLICFFSFTWAIVLLVNFKDSIFVYNHYKSVLASILGNLEWNFPLYIWNLAFFTPAMFAGVFASIWSDAKPKTDPFWYKARLRDALGIGYARILTLLTAATLIISILYYCSFGYLGKLLPGFTPLFRYPIYGNLPENINYLFYGISVIPMLFAFFITNIVLTIMKFVINYAVFTLVIVGISVMYTLYERYRARKEFKEMHLNDVGLNIKLTDKEYDLLIRLLESDSVIKEKIRAMRELKLKYMTNS